MVFTVIFILRVFLKKFKQKGRLKYLKVLVDFQKEILEKMEGR